MPITHRTRASIDGGFDEARKFVDKECGIILLYVLGGVNVSIPLVLFSDETLCLEVADSHAQASTNAIYGFRIRLFFHFSGLGGSNQ